MRFSESGFKKTKTGRKGLSDTPSQLWLCARGTAFLRFNRTTADSVSHTRKYFHVTMAFFVQPFHQRHLTATVDVISCDYEYIFYVEWKLWSRHLGG
jgi:hypothetical protein